MKKFSKIGKRVLAFFLVALMNINTYATTTANDGSSFVTKAEFDDMMYDFNIKMNEYQSALNAKIDASISSYLAGMSAQSVLDLENYAKMAKEHDENYAKFTQWKTPVASENVHDVYGAFCVNKANGTGIGDNGDRDGIFGWCGINNNQAYGGTGSFVRYTNYTGSTDNFTSSYYFAEFPYKEDSNYQDWTLERINRRRLNFKLSAINTVFRSAQFTDKDRDTVVMVPATTYTADYTRLTQPGSFEHPSVGELGSMSNMQFMAVQTHEWTNRANTDTTNNAFLKYNLSGTVAGTDYAVDYEKRDYYDTSAPVTLPIQKDPSSETAISGAHSGSAVAIIYHDRLLYEYRGTKQYYFNITFNFKYNRPTIYNLNWTRLTNDYFNTLLAKPVYKYNGMPITKTNREGTIKFTLTLNNPSTGTYVYAISDKAFENGAIPEHMYETVGGKQYDHILLRGAVSRSGDEVIDVSLDKAKVYDTIKGDVLWLKVEPSVAGEVVSATVSNNIREYLNN